MVRCGQLEAFILAGIRCGRVGSVSAGRGDSFGLARCSGVLACMGGRRDGPGSRPGRVIGGLGTIAVGVLELSAMASPPAGGRWRGAGSPS